MYESYIEGTIKTDSIRLLDLAVRDLKRMFASMCIFKETIFKKILKENTMSVMHHEESQVKI